MQQFSHALGEQIETDLTFLGREAHALGRFQGGLLRFLFIRKFRRCLEATAER